MLGPHARLSLSAPTGARGSRSPTQWTTPAGGYNMGSRSALKAVRWRSNLTASLASRVRIRASGWSSRSVPRWYAALRSCSGNLGIAPNERALSIYRPVAPACHGASPAMSPLRARWGPGGRRGNLSSRAVQRVGAQRDTARWRPRSSLQPIFAYHGPTTRPAAPATRLTSSQADPFLRLQVCDLRIRSQSCLLPSRAPT
jgi:hypothetical protein